jgi:hypothetical protein
MERGLKEIAQQSTVEKFKHVTIEGKCNSGEIFS